MKLQIDFDKKTIKIEDAVNFGTLVERLQSLLTDWKDYTIFTNTKIEWREYPVYKYKNPFDNWPLGPYYGVSHELINCTLGNKTNIVNLELNDL